ncbi:hypothetical protein ABN228_03885 [Providencia rettgeri]|uniref:hypothetical protein n=1 Tax=Providencia rettgeri TaxID=587 RepID=UPI0032DA8CF4
MDIMTTTVYDRINKQVACDSRWSVDLTQHGYTGHILYVDDTGFEKIANRGDFAMVVAGNGGLIQRWKEWWSSEALEQMHPPVVLPTGQCISLYIVQKSKNKVIFDKGHKLAALNADTNEIEAVFSGSGGNHAANDWFSFHDSKNAVEFAKQNDFYTGGTVRYVEFETDTHNLQDELMSFDLVVHSILNKGRIMDTKNPHLEHVAITADEVAHVRQMVINGSITPCAPTGKDTTDWDENSKGRLLDAIKYIQDAESAI